MVLKGALLLGDIGLEALWDTTEGIAQHLVHGGQGTAQHPTMHTAHPLHPNKDTSTLVDCPSW